MEFLKALEATRTPFFDWFFSLITVLGEETIFLVVVLIYFWCFNKKRGYQLLYIYLFGTWLNQWLKLLFSIPRPWVKDPSFTIVESARAAATGFSFPSGHTQGVTALFASLAVFIKRSWVTVVCGALILLTAISRLYLGVHTPADVVVSLLLGLLSVFILTRMFDWLSGKKLEILPYIAMVALSVAFVAYVSVFSDGSYEYASGTENSWKLLGCSIALLIVWIVESKYIRYDTSAVWWKQVVKVIIGAAVVLVIKTFTKQPLLDLLGPAGNAVRYGLIVLFVGIVYPMAFKKLFNKKSQ